MSTKTINSPVSIFISERLGTGENNDDFISTELPDDDENDVNGDDLENARINGLASFFLTRGESASEKVTL